MSGVDANGNCNITLQYDLVEQWNSLLQEAVHKWLSPETILFVLLNVQQLNLSINTIPPSQPGNGQIYIYDRGATKNFKVDGVNWAKKKNQKNRVQETYDTMRIGGYELHRVYCRSADDPNFQRRIYRLNNESSPIVIVHYRHCSLISTDAISHLSFEASPEPTLQPMSTGAYRANSSSSGSAGSMLGLAPTYQKSDHQNSFGIDGGLEKAILNMPQILDFAPSSGALYGGEKVLICLSSDLPSAVLHEVALRRGVSPITVGFGSAQVSGEFISASTIRCFSPRVTAPGPATVTVRVLNQQITCGFSEGSSFFTYRNNGDVENNWTTFSSLNATSAEPKMHSWTASSSQQIASLGHGPDKSKQRVRKFDPITDSNMNEGFLKDNILNTDSVSFGNNHKVRLVSSVLPLSRAAENGVVNNTLDEENKYFDVDFFEFVKQSIEKDGSAAASVPKDVEDLPPTVLETLTQEYLSTMLTDVVTLATQDNELVGELDMLDSTGYNFMHYCSMFNLHTLLSTLLSRGAQPDVLTSTGSTALHLASAQGHMEVIKLLIQSGCNCNIIDSNGFTAREISRQNGHMTLYEYLSAYTEVPASSPLLPHDSSMYPTPSQPSHPPDANSEMIEENDKNENPPHDPGMTEEQISSQVIHQVFHSLSITEKCALAISIARTQKQKLQRHLSSTNLSSMNLSATETNNRSSNDFNESSVRSQATLSGPYMMASGYRDAEDCDKSLSRIDTADDEDRTNRSSRVDADDDELQLEIQSVMSEQDVGMVMRLMGDMELSEVEREVLLIQANVRAWLLRKNYTNLRASVKSLQQAWRERRRNSSSASTSTKIPAPSSAAASQVHSEGFKRQASPPAHSYKSLSVSAFSGTGASHGVYDDSSISPAKNTSALLSSASEGGRESTLTPIREEMDAEVVSVGSFDLDAFPMDDSSTRSIDAPTRGQVSSRNAPGTSSLFTMHPLSSSSAPDPQYFGIPPDSLLENRMFDSPSGLQHDQVSLSLCLSSVPMGHGESISHSDTPSPGVTAIASTSNASTREAFSNLRRQAVASMVIQRNLVRFWRDKNKK